MQVAGMVGEGRRSSEDPVDAVAVLVARELWPWLCPHACIQPGVPAMMTMMSRVCLLWGRSTTSGVVSRVLHQLKPEAQANHRSHTAVLHSRGEGYQRWGVRWRRQIWQTWKRSERRMAAVTPLE